MEKQHVRQMRHETCVLKSTAAHDWCSGQRSTREEGYTSVVVLFHDILKKILNKVILWISFSCDTLILTVTVVI